MRISRGCQPPRKLNGTRKSIPKSVGETKPGVKLIVDVPSAKKASLQPYAPPGPALTLNEANEPGLGSTSVKLKVRFVDRCRRSLSSNCVFAPRMLIPKI